MVYYVDSIYGRDENDGCSRQTAFRTVARINSLTLQGGDSVLFKAGGVYPGSLIPRREPGRKPFLLIATAWGRPR